MKRLQWFAIAAMLCVVWAISPIYRYPGEIIGGVRQLIEWLAG